MGIYIGLISNDEFRKAQPKNTSLFEINNRYIFFMERLSVQQRKKLMVKLSGVEISLFSDVCKV